MHLLEQLETSLKGKRDLDATQIAEAVRALTNPELAAEVKMRFLCALTDKGETTEEIAAFARELRELSVIPPIDLKTRQRGILDVCGTGGDQLNTYNISTTVALIAASAGIAVAKHGNRGITSKSGSADVLEALGISVNLSPAKAAESLGQHNFAFFYAPQYHPAFQHISAARKLCATQGKKTIFNFLGPLLNPARPQFQLAGVPRPALCAPLAKVLQTLGSLRAMVVSGEVPDETSGTIRYLDEISTLGETHVAEFYQERGFTESAMSPHFYPLQSAKLQDLAGGGPSENAQIIRDILSGRDQGPRRDAALLNSAAALFVSGKCATMQHGWELANELIDSGAAQAKVKELMGVIN